MTRLKNFRHQIGWTQIQVAVRAGVSRETVRKLERGEWQTARFGTVVKVAHSMGASPADLIPAIMERPPAGSRRRK